MSNYNKNKTEYGRTNYQQISYNSATAKKERSCIGCTCGGNGPCRATCCILFTESSRNL